jgi:threonine/homoserine efflux transporter RhtA
MKRSFPKLPAQGIAFLRELVMSLLMALLQKLALQEFAAAEKISHLAYSLLKTQI